MTPPTGAESSWRERDGAGDLPGSPAVHRPWSTVLQVGYVLALGLGVVVALAGLWLVVSTGAPSSSPPDEADEPWGLVIGVVMLAVAAVVIPVGASLARATARGRTQADAGDTRALRGAAVAGIWLGVLAVLPVLVLMMLLPVTVLLLPLAALHVVAAVRTLRAAPR